MTGKYSMIAQTKIAKNPTNKIKSINWLIIKLFQYVFIIIIFFQTQIFSKIPAALFFIFGALSPSTAKSGRKYRPRPKPKQSRRR